MSLLVLFYVTNNLLHHSQKLLASHCQNSFIDIDIRVAKYTEIHTADLEKLQELKDLVSPHDNPEAQNKLIK